MIAEMQTGEGKTLVATLPVFLNALTGLGVHVITVWRWERGHLTPNPTQERLLAAIERALDTDPSLPQRLADIGSDELRELVAVLGTVYPEDARLAAGGA
jgi:hypothetical protein